MLAGFDSARKSLVGCWGRIAINGPVGYIDFRCSITVSQARYAHWCDNDPTVRV